VVAVVAVVMVVQGELLSGKSVSNKLGADLNSGLRNEFIFLAVGKY